MKLCLLSIFWTTAFWCFKLCPRSHVFSTHPDQPSDLAGRQAAVSPWVFHVELRSIFIPRSHKPRSFESKFWRRSTKQIIRCTKDRTPSMFKILFDSNPDQPSDLAGRQAAAPPPQVSHAELHPIRITISSCTIYYPRICTRICTPHSYHNIFMHNILSKGHPIHGIYYPRICTPNSYHNIFMHNVLSKDRVARAPFFFDRQCAKTFQGLGPLGRTSCARTYILYRELGVSCCGKVFLSS